MNKWRAIGFGFGAVALIAFAVYATWMLRGQDLSRYLAPSAFAGVVACALLYTLLTPITAWAWGRLLLDLGVEQSWRSLLQIMSITQIAKYVPGNVGYHLGRVGMAHVRKIALPRVILSIALETLLAILAAVLVGIAATCLSRATGVVLIHSRLTAIISIAALAAVLLAILTLGRNAIIRLIQRLSSAKMGSSLVLAKPRLQPLVGAFLAYCLNFSVAGCAITLMASLLLPGISHDPLLLTGSFAIAWAVGFIVVGAPAGLGVREGVMLAMLRWGYSDGNAVVLIVATRLATTISDLVCLVIGAVLTLGNREVNSLGAMPFKTEMQTEDDPAKSNAK